MEQFYKNLEELQLDINLNGKNIN